jgi:hypothetical protein
MVFAAIIAAARAIFGRSVAAAIACAFWPTQRFQCPFDGRVCSSNRRRLLGNEPVSHGDSRTQNGILRRVMLVMHCQPPPIAVEPHTPLLQDRLVRGEGGLVATHAPPLDPWVKPAWLCLRATTLGRFGMKKFLAVFGSMKALSASSVDRSIGSPLSCRVAKLFLTMAAEKTPR